MKFLSTFWILLAFNFHVFGQIKTRFKIASVNYSIDGTIFDKSYNHNGYPDFADSINRITPTYLQVRTAEDMLLNNRTNVEYVDLNGVLKKENLKNELRTYKRQYVGYINGSKDTIIIIHALDFKEKRAAKRAFRNWEKDYIVAFDGFYSTAIITFSINLDKKTVTLY